MYDKKCASENGSYINVFGGDQGVFLKLFSRKHLLREIVIALTNYSETINYLTDPKVTRDLLNQFLVQLIFIMHFK